MHRPLPEGELFEHVYRTVGTAVLGYTLRRCASRDDAYDVVADTFAVAWRRRTDMPEDPDEARLWLFGIARRCLANAARSSTRASRLGQRLADWFPPGAVPDPAAVHEQSADAGLVRAALLTLPDDDRDLLTLVACEGLTPAQAAVVLGLTPGATRVRLHRARARLRAALPDSDLTEETSDDH